MYLSGYNLLKEAVTGHLLQQHSGESVCQDVLLFGNPNMLDYGSVGMWGRCLQI